MVTLQQKLDHIHRLCSSVDLPVSADLENGFSDDPREVAGTILKAAEAGAVGGSIEDHTRAPNHRIYDFEAAVQRVYAAAEAARSLEFPFMLTARAEGLLGSRMGLDEVIRRLRAFEAAGADVLYAPGLKTLADVQEVAASLTKPLNVLGYMVAGATPAQLAEAGAKRISLGPALSRVAIAALLNAVAEIREKGSFAWAEDLPSGTEVAALIERGASDADKG
jgi:2-methylisocitrate lyase-like PEP mutase family enzyme